MWVLQLHDMRRPKSEGLKPVLRAETKEALEKAVSDNETDLYFENKIAKCFKKDGPLEFCDYPSETGQHYINVGTEETWAENAREQFQTQIMSILEA